MCGLVSDVDAYAYGQILKTTRVHIWRKPKGLQSCAQTNNLLLKVNKTKELNNGSSWTTSVSGSYTHREPVMVITYTTSKPPTSEVNNNDHVNTMQWYTGKLWVHASGCYFDTHHPPKHYFRLSTCSCQRHSQWQDPPSRMWPAIPQKKSWETWLKVQGIHLVIKLPTSHLNRAYVGYH